MTEPSRETYDSIALCFPAIGLAIASLALSQGEPGYEVPATVQAADAAPAALLQGKHHRVAPEVRADGYLYRFQLTSDFGPFEAAGRTMLATRVQEIEGIASLQEVSKSEVFVKAAGQSVVNVGKGVATRTKPRDRKNGRRVGVSRSPGARQTGGRVGHKRH